MSPMIEPNFSEAGRPFSPGHHVCTIVSSELKLSRANNPYVKWRLVAADGFTVYYSTPIAGRAAGMFKHLIHSAGELEYQEGPYDSDKLNGKSVMMTLEAEHALDGSGKIYPKVVEVAPVVKSDFENYGGEVVPF